jgi:hypothetical protein
MDDKLLNLIQERKDPCPIEYFDPSSSEHKIQCVPESLQSQFLIDKKIESNTLI